jgi:hypothetical protein
MDEAAKVKSAHGPSPHLRPLLAVALSKIKTAIVYDKIVFCHNAAMTPSRPRTSRVFTISFPEELAKQVVLVAEEESRNISELFREAFRAYRMERNERKLIAARADAAQRWPQTYTAADVEAIVDEIRSEHYAQRKITA